MGCTSSKSSNLSKTATIEKFWLNLTSVNTYRLKKSKSTCQELSAMENSFYYLWFSSLKRILLQFRLHFRICRIKNLWALTILNNFDCLLSILVDVLYGSLRSEILRLWIWRSEDVSIKVKRKKWLHDLTFMS